MAAKKYAVAGPWDDEPDEWHGEFHGLKVRAVRHSVFGSWCGYVILQRDHPQYGVSYEQIDADAYGGVNYAEHGAYQDNLQLMEHALRDDDVWEVGFDCGHGYDYQPGMSDLGRDVDRYKTLEFMKGELERLAAQLTTEKSNHI